MTLAAEIWQNVDELKELIGSEELLDEIIRAMSTDEAEDVLSFIRTNHGIQ